MALQIDRLALWKEKPAGAGVDPDSAGCAAGAAARDPGRAPRGLRGGGSSETHARAPRSSARALTGGGAG